MIPSTKTGSSFSNSANVKDEIEFVYGFDLENGKMDIMGDAAPRIPVGVLFFWELIYLVTLQKQDGSLLV